VSAAAGDVSQAADRGLILESSGLLPSRSFSIEKDCDDVQPIVAVGIGDVQNPSAVFGNASERIHRAARRVGLDRFGLSDGPQHPFALDLALRKYRLCVPAERDPARVHGMLFG
jgi:hypothetical protein